MRRESWAKFVGFLAGRQATIHAQIKDWALGEWTTRYQSATGLQIPPPGDGYQVVTPDVNKWANSASIAVSATMNEIWASQAFSALPLDVEVKEHAGQVMIYSEEVMWDLFDCGFVLGTEQPVVAIREKFPQALWADFDTGLALGVK